MKLIIVSLIAVFFATTDTAETNVYICNSKGGKRYHWKKDCRGLARCEAEIKELTEQQAKDLGKTLCGYEK